MRNLRTYGRSPFNIVVLHGGPGAPGEMGTVARELASAGGVLEPLQTAESIEGHVEELRLILEEHADPPVVLVGWSWGAMLGFIFAARHPSLVARLIMVGSGAFEEKYAVDIMTTRLDRLGEIDRAEVVSLMEALETEATPDKNRLMGRLGKLIACADAYDPLPDEDEELECSYEAYQKVWQEAALLRKSGELLALSRKIRCPVTAIHGDHDPHPYHGVEGPLSRVLPDFRFILLEKCSHKPWQEKGVKDKFYDIIRQEIG